MTESNFPKKNRFEFIFLAIWLILLPIRFSSTMQIALSYVNQEPVIEKRYSPARAERIFTQNLQAVKIIRSINTILGLLLNAELSKIEKPSPDDRSKVKTVWDKKYNRVC